MESTVVAKSKVYQGHSCHKSSPVDIAEMEYLITCTVHEIFCNKHCTFNFADLVFNHFSTSICSILTQL